MPNWYLRNKMMVHFAMVREACLKIFVNLQLKLQNFFIPTLPSNGMPMKGHGDSKRRLAESSTPHLKNNILTKSRPFKLKKWNRGCMIVCVRWCMPQGLTYVLPRRPTRHQTETKSCRPTLPRENDALLWVPWAHVLDKNSVWYRFWISLNFLP